MDIWSLGVILYEALSGVRPLEGDNAAQLVMRLLSTGIMPIEHLVPELPGELSALIGRMLSRDIARRPADLREVYAVLAALSGGISLPFGAPPPRAGAALHEPFGATPSPRPAPPTFGGLASADSALLETHTAIEMNTSPLALGDAARARGRQRRRLVVAALGGGLLLGGLLWLARGEAPLTARAPIPTAANAQSGPSEVPRVVSGSATSADEPASAAAPVAESAPVAARAAPRSVPTNAAIARAAPSLASNARTRRDAPKRARTAARALPPSRTPASASEARAAPVAHERTRGSECESSSECSSGLCVAYVCQ